MKNYIQNTQSLILLLRHLWTSCLLLYSKFLKSGFEIRFARPWTELCSFGNWWPIMMIRMKSGRLRLQRIVGASFRGILIDSLGEELRTPPSLLDWKLLASLLKPVSWKQVIIFVVFSCAIRNLHLQNELVRGYVCAYVHICMRTCLYGKFNSRTTEVRLRKIWQLQSALNDLLNQLSSNDWEGNFATIKQKNKYL